MHWRSIALGLLLFPAAQARSQTADPLGLEPVALPAPLDRVLRDYEAAWEAGDGKRLAALFTEDGFALSNGRLPMRGRAAIEAWHTRPGGEMRQHPVARVAPRRHDETVARNRRRARGVAHFCDLA